MGLAFFSFYNLLFSYFSNVKKFFFLQCKQCPYTSGEMTTVYKHYQMKHGFRGVRSGSNLDNHIFTTTMLIKSKTVWDHSQGLIKVLVGPRPFFIFAS